MVTKDAHEPLISRRVYQHALDRLAQRAAERPTLPKPPENGWAGPRSPKARFLLSGLCRCARCGSRYEGHGAPTGSSTTSGRREKVWSYACGGYIRHGRSTCTRGGVSQPVLERRVVDAVREYYERLTGDAGRQILIREIDRLLLGEGAAATDAKGRITKRLEKIDRTMRNLLDNLSPATREIGERRILELERERTECTRELAAIESLSATKREARAMADEAFGYIATTVAALGAWNGERDGVDTITTALRRCIHDLTIDAPNGNAVIYLRTLPVLASGPAFLHTEQVTISTVK